MEKLGQWLNWHSEPANNQSADQPPVFTSQLTRPITPTSDDSRLQPLTCLLFSKLPFEIRRAIFIAAFGHRVVHIDLVFDYPLLDPRLVRIPTGRTPNHADIYVQKTDHRSPPPRGQKAWRWGGTVCHRDYPNRSKRLWRYKAGPWGDDCMQGGAGWVCDRYGGPFPHSCRVGIMGLLLSCKQAYTEGIDVVFSTNCISLISQPLLLRLPELILPQRLELIRSMEMAFGGFNSYLSSSERTLDVSRLAQVLDHISMHCRNLHSLWLSLDIYEGTDTNELINGPALAIIDSFYLSMDLNDMILEVPKVIYDKVGERTVAVGPFHPFEPEKPKEGNLDWWNPWRCLDGVDSQGRPKPKPEIQWRTLGNYPRPPLHLPMPENSDKYVPSRGYWFKDGFPYISAGSTYSS